MAKSFRHQDRHIPIELQVSSVDKTAILSIDTYIRESYFLNPLRKKINNRKLTNTVKYHITTYLVIWTNVCKIYVRIDS